MEEQIKEDLVEEPIKEMSDKEKIADLVLENQVLRHKATILAELALGASKVLDYYASSRLPYPVFTLVESINNGALFTKTHYKIVEVVDGHGPDKQFFLDVAMHDLKMDIETAKRASRQILDTFQELGIILEEVEVEEESQEDDGINQLSLDFSNSGENNENKVGEES